MIIHCRIGCCTLPQTRHWTLAKMFHNGKAVFAQLGRGAELVPVKDVHNLCLETFLEVTFGRCAHFQGQFVQFVITRRREGRGGFLTRDHGERWWFNVAVIKGFHSGSIIKQRRQRRLQIALIKELIVGLSATPWQPRYCRRCCSCSWISTVDLSCFGADQRACAPRGSCL